ncbi:MAG: GH32 C-terminal domain-containing protein, partial [Lachnospiraceae bacterium]|nr:GH32 C-terminal domain-containing protein [Lachnospiraceae bacterium]
DFYAPQTFEAPDGRRILIGWMGIGDSAYTNPTTALGWQHCLTIPRELSRLEDGTLLQNPMREYDSLRGEKITLKEEQKVSLPFDLTAQINGDFEIIINNGPTLSLRENMFCIDFNNQPMGYGRTIRRVRTEQCRDIRMIADMSSIEVYLDGGRYVMSTRFYPDEENIRIKADGINAEIYKMNGMEVRINGE